MVEVGQSLNAKIDGVLAGKVVGAHGKGLCEHVEVAHRVKRPIVSPRRERMSAGEPGGVD